MRFGFEQRWDAPVDRVMEVYLDPEFWRSLVGLAKTSAPELVSIERTDDRAVVRLRFHLAVTLPREAARFIDPDDVTWVETHDWDLASRRAEVRFEPEQASALIRASATSTLRTDGDDTVREVRGELKVRIPLLGGRVENAIVSGIGDQLVEEADAVADRLG